MKFVTMCVGNKCDSKLQCSLYNGVPNLAKSYWDFHTIKVVFKKNDCFHILLLKTCFSNTFDVML